MPVGCGCGCGQVTIRSCTEAASDEHYDARSATIPNLQLRHDYSTAVYLHYHFAKSHTPASHHPAPTTRATTPLPPLAPRPSPSPWPSPPPSPPPPPPPAPPPSTHHSQPTAITPPRTCTHTDKARCNGGEGVGVVSWVMGEGGCGGGRWSGGVDEARRPPTTISLCL